MLLEDKKRTIINTDTIKFCWCIKDRIMVKFIDSSCEQFEYKNKLTHDNDYTRMNDRVERYN
jgi:hypothetical protein